MPPGILPHGGAVFVLRAEVANAESADLVDDDCAQRPASRLRRWPHQLLGQHQRARFGCAFGRVKLDLVTPETSVLALRYKTRHEPQLVWFADKGAIRIAPFPHVEVGSGLDEEPSEDGLDCRDRGLRAASVDD